jgi:large subunit ribosomal protein L11
MPKQEFQFLIEAGKASAGPPIGTSLGPLKINVAKVVEEINRKTADMAGMQVPVKVRVNTETKTFEIEIGTPPVAALIKKELGIQSGSPEPGRQRVGDLSPEQVVKIAKLKFGSDAQQFIRLVEGTARSMGVTIGKGAITEEERKKYEAMKAAKEAEAAKKASKA